MSKLQFEIVVFEVPITKMAPPPSLLLSASEILLEKQEPVIESVPAVWPIAPPLSDTHPLKVQLVTVTFAEAPIICMAPPFSVDDALSF